MNKIIYCIALLICLSSCSSDDSNSSYNPVTIDDIDFQENAAGLQFMDYVENRSTDSSCILNYTNFLTGSFEIVEGEEKELIDLAVVINSYPESQLRIDGHTDSDGNDSINMALSLNRAQEVMEFLINQEVDSERLTFRGFGSTMPIATNDTAEGKRKNRRVEAVISK